MHTGYAMRCVASATESPLRCDTRRRLAGTRQLPRNASRSACALCKRRFSVIYVVYVHICQSFLDFVTLARHKTLENFNCH